MELLQASFSGAPLPATLVLILACVYWMFAIVAGLDLDILDLDLEVETESHAKLHDVLGVGVLVLRFLNVGRVPLMIWGSVFALTWWVVSILLDRLLDDPAARDQWFYAVQYAIRNFALAVMSTKIFTQPLRGRFESEPPHAAETMLGKHCRVVSSEVNERFGQAEYTTGAAPLRIHVRTQGGPPLAKGDAAVIVAFDPEKQIYYVEPVKAEV